MASDISGAFDFRGAGTSPGLLLPELSEKSETVMVNALSNERMFCDLMVDVVTKAWPVVRQVTKIAAVDCFIIFGKAFQGTGVECSEMLLAKGCL